MLRPLSDAIRVTGVSTQQGLATIQARSIGAPALGLCKGLYPEIGSDLRLRYRLGQDFLRPNSQIFLDEGTASEA